MCTGEDCFIEQTLNRTGKNFALEMKPDCTTDVSQTQILESCPVVIVQAEFPDPKDLVKIVSKEGENALKSTGYIYITSVLLSWVVYINRVSQLIRYNEVTPLLLLLTQGGYF